jgi:hypothetical protein
MKIPRWTGVLSNLVAQFVLIILKYRFHVSRARSVCSDTLLIVPYAVTR